MTDIAITERDRSDFIRNGFFAKRGLLDEDACRRCRDIAWRELGKKAIDQDPDSWRENPYLRERKGIVKLRDELNSDPAILETFKSNQALRSVARGLIGESMGDPDVRGLYPTFPIPTIRAYPHEAHLEMHLVQVFVMIYLDDVTEQNGAMCVWPGTHARVTHLFESKLDFRPGPEFHKEFASLNLFAPVQLTGKAGDAFFCHHRILHAGSDNTRNNVRFGVLVDFLRNDFEALRRTAPGEDMWDYWSDELRSTASSGPIGDSDSLQSSASRWLLLTAAHTARRLRGKRPNAYAP